MNAATHTAKPAADFDARTEILLDFIREVRDGFENPREHVWPTLLLDVARLVATRALHRELNTELKKHWNPSAEQTFEIARRTFELGEDLVRMDFVTHSWGRPAQVTAEHVVIMHKALALAVVLPR